MEEVQGTTALMRLVDQLRAEMTEAYYDDNDDRMKMRKPTIQVNLKDTYGGWFGESIELSITLKQLRSICSQHDAHLENARVWQGDAHYLYRVYGGESKWSDKITITMGYEFTDLRVKDDTGYIGYTDVEGRTVLWNHTSEE